MRSLVVLAMSLLFAPAVQAQPAAPLPGDAEVGQSLVWLLVAAALVLMMQFGFMMLEAGLVRSKNSVNVAQKNLLDLLFSIVAFAAFGFMIAFGAGSALGVGFDLDLLMLSNLTPFEQAFFAFQVMFCGTAATIVSGAAAERLRLSSYVICSLAVGAVIYPVYAHWAWGSALGPSPAAFLANLGYIDFAGSSVVHMTGGFVSLAVCLVLGPRIGRYAPDGKMRRIPGHSAVLATGGAMVLFVGWLGFNGGSTIYATPLIGLIVTNTVLAGGVGGCAGYVFGLYRDGGIALPERPIFGLLGGLVAVTAGCHILTPAGAMAIGALGGLVAVGGSSLIEERFKVDDAVGAIGVHGLGGIAGILGLALLAPESAFSSGSRLEQLGVQALGAGVNFVWAFGLSYLLFRVMDAVHRIRVSAADEERGLNQAEHATALGIGNLELALGSLADGSADLSLRLAVDQGDEAERATRLFNEFLDRVQNSETARRGADDLRRAEMESERLSTLADAAPDGIVVSVDDHIVDCNGAFCELLGLEAADIYGLDLVDQVAQENRADLRTLLASSGAKPIEITIYDRDGRPIPVEVRNRLIVLRERETSVTALIDLRERRHAEERIRFMAQHDPLTGLPNRRLFSEYLAGVLARIASDGGSAALLWVDLDRFKDINDLYGHPTGDIVIQRSGARLKALVGTNGMAARCGGDEFAVVVPTYDFQNQVLDLAFRIVESLGEPIDIGGGVVLRPGASVGVSMAPRDGLELDTVVSRADTALYEAKRQGRNSFAVFEPGMDKELQARRLLEDDLGQAIERGELIVYFQPRVDLRSKRIVSYEALLRWKHPVRGMVSPADFIPIAEQTGKIIQIGDWVLREACRQAKAHFPDVSISVNVSAFQFRNRQFIEMTMQALGEIGFDPGKLELELTESVLIEDRDRALASLKKLKSHGIRLALDDFGTGYSSLSYLRLFPFDTIKIDQSFVRDMSESRGSLAITRTVIELGRALALQIVAEGVETVKQLRALREKGCDEVQGYLLGRPMPIGELVTEVPQALVDLLSDMEVFDTWPACGGTPKKKAA